MGFFILETAPTAPNPSLSPSIRDASHSTPPSQVRLEPKPAFVYCESSKTTVAMATASTADFPLFTASIPYDK